MILSMKWLSDFVSTDGIEIKQYCDRMTDTGSKVEGYEYPDGAISGVAVGEILEIARHPDADKLVVCRVNVGAAEPIQIVTAATNVFVGARVPVALDGANLCGGIKIKKSKLRGVESDGMFCSIAELGLTTHDMPGAVEDGILILGDVGLPDAEPGRDVKELLMMDDAAVEFEITPNRPDCLSVRGLARETAVSFGVPLNLPEAKFPEDMNDGDDIRNYIDVEIKNPERCYRYSAKVVKNVRIAPSPLWLRMRLRASGVRPINNIVDITNYVMLEYGQPMHAFDYACLEGKKINVRDAREGEIFVSLDDIEHKLDPTMLVIADENKAVALAGVMGGANSGISESTKTVVFESAMFHPGNVRVTAQKQGMRTESSSRFEKGLDSETTVPALKRACELIKLLDAGDVVDGMIDVYPKKKEKVVLPLEADRINGLLGTDVDVPFMMKTLRDLQFGTDEENLTVTVPTFRDDVRTMNDLAEEVIRIWGYNDIPSSLPHAVTIGARTDKQAFDVKVRDTLCGMGFDEIQTFSFISPKYYDRIRLPEGDPRRNSVTIINPLGEDTSVMRTTAIPSMLEVLSRNYSVKNRDVRLFEMATTYLPKDDPAELPDEVRRIVMGAYGDKDPSGEGFYRLKGEVEGLLGMAGISDVKFVPLGSEPTFHPGRCAGIMIAGEAAGIIGQAHPKVAEEYGVGVPVYLCDLDFMALFAARKTKVDYKPLPKYPAIERDFSFVCGEDLAVGDVSDEIRRAGGKKVVGVELFDVYRGVQVGPQKKSVSFAVMLRDEDKTMTDEDADRIVGKVLKALEEKFDVTLRK